VRQGDQSPDQVGAAARHPDIGQDQRGAVLASGRHRLVAVDDLPDDVEIRLLLQQHGESGSDAEVVVRDDDGELAADGGGHSSTLAQRVPVVVMRAHRSSGAWALGATATTSPAPIRPRHIASATGGVLCVSDSKS
jgi:hypothetical protein